MKAHVSSAAATIVLMTLSVAVGVTMALLPAVRASACTLPDGSQGAPSAADEQGRVCCPMNATGANQQQQCILEKYISPAIQLVSAAVGILVVISIIYGGFEIVTAGSDVGRAAAGRKRIIQTLVGLGAYMGLVALMQFLIPGGII